MQIQFNSDSSVMGTENVAERISAMVAEKLARFEDRLTRVEIYVSDDNGPKRGADDKSCTIEARPRNEAPLATSEHGETVDKAARAAANTLVKRLRRHFGREDDRHKYDPRPDKAL